ncbi:MAG: YCF48-related protein [Ignavibacteriaceae bacterium]|nr:YCF48-related protein [Ignavibacteriaceae bacterium]
MRFSKQLMGVITWTNISNPNFPNLNSLYFVDSDFGYVVGDSGYVLRTTDGGLNWETTQLDSTINLNSIHFSNPYTGFIVGGFGSIYKTTNVGKCIGLI